MPKSTTKKTPSEKGDLTKIKSLRNQMDILDKQLAQLLVNRIELAQKISKKKKRLKLNPLDLKRELEIEKHYQGKLAKFAKESQVTRLVRQIIRINPKR